MWFIQYIRTHAHTHRSKERGWLRLLMQHVTSHFRAAHITDAMHLRQITSILGAHCRERISLNNSRYALMWRNAPRTGNWLRYYIPEAVNSSRTSLPPNPPALVCTRGLGKSGLRRGKTREIRDSVCWLTARSFELSESKQQRAQPNDRTVKSKNW